MFVFLFCWFPVFVCCLLQLDSCKGPHSLSFAAFSCDGFVCFSQFIFGSTNLWNDLAKVLKGRTEKRGGTPIYLSAVLHVFRISDCIDFMAAIGLKATKKLSVADLAYLANLQGGNYRWPRGGKVNLWTMFRLFEMSKELLPDFGTSVMSRN